MVGVMDKIDILRELADEEYQEWRKYWRSGERQISNERSRLINYYARLAHIAHLERKEMGVEKNKLAQRIGRQRFANNRMRRQKQELELKLEKASEENREFRKEIIRKHEERWAEYEKELSELRRDRDKPAF